MECFRMLLAALAILCLDGVRAVQPEEAPPPSPVIVDFSRPFDYVYGDFEKGVIHRDGVVHIRTRASRGGAGINRRMDLSSFADDGRAPALRMKVGPENEAETVNAFFADGAGHKSVFNYRLEDADPEQFELVLPESGASLQVPNEGRLPGQERLDYGSVTVMQVQGAWKDAALDVYIDAVEMVEPPPAARRQRDELLAGLQRKADRLRAEAEKQAAERREALKGQPHRPEDPDVVHVCAVAPDILAVTIQARRVERVPQVPYASRPGDEIVEDGKEVLARHGSEIVRTRKDLKVLRPTDGGKKDTLGALAINADKIAPPQPIHGEPLNDIAVLAPEAYSISSTDDPAYADHVTPTAVHRKSKPNSEDADNQYPIRHWIYLELPQPLRGGSTYAIRFQGLNTSRESVSYVHEPRRVRSDAVHVTQVGYRPEDPFKRAYLSTWLGTGGALGYEAGTFYLLDENGDEAHRGEVKLALAADEPEHLKEEKNFTKTNVYRLDFPEFTTPGTYRVLVPGIGTSYPFEIGEGVWLRAFCTSMKGFLHHRSGIELGPPFTDYVRPRPMHPADGFKVFNLDITYWTGEAAAVNRALARMLGPDLDTGRLDTHPDAWGGYMDAGDWDRRSQHLRPSYLHLELLELFPDYFQEVALALPPEEAQNDLPDLLDEALWNVAFYRRLQRPDGGVGGGVESTAHPRAGECSWQESLCVGTFAPDPETTYRFAACAAKAARLLRAYDRGLAAQYGESATKAWAWAESEGPAMAEEAGEERDTRKMRALAAAELYHLTEEPRYNAAFREAILAGNEPFDAERDAWFAYALLPDELADGDLKERAVEGYRMLGDVALKFAAGNAFDITTDVPGLPMIGYVGYYSTPGMTVGPGLPRAHYLTGERKYLAGTVAACNFSAGANPMNKTMTVGVGHRNPRFPLHIDSRRSGRPAPEGITVFGPFDPRRSGGAYDWAHTWVLRGNMTPESRTWPATEFYVDIYKWPPMSEYTVHQTMEGTSYHWGYLAARR